jgi:hypothetical protein
MDEELSAKVNFWIVDGMVARGRKMSFKLEIFDIF